MGYLPCASIENSALVHRLWAGLVPVVGRLGSGVRVSASFQW